MVRWVVIGAGPAGIASIGCLLDRGYAKHEIAWVDPLFEVGDFGYLWRSVPSNTKVKIFLKYLNACAAFEISRYANNFNFFEQNPESNCKIALIADVLLAITQTLKTKVKSYKDYATELNLTNRQWQITLKSGHKICASQVILAIGASAKTLKYNFPMIDLACGLNPTVLSQYIKKNECIAVFGSSHSAILVLKNLLEYSDCEVINFYRSSLRYAIELDNWILFDDTGLKGEASSFARQYIDGNLPNNPAAIIPVVGK